MAIQQSIQVDLVLVGDGSATVFTYAFNKLFTAGNSQEPAMFTNSTTVPTSATVVNNPIFPTCVASLDGFGNLILTFTSAPGNGTVGPISVQLLFNSGTLAGTTQAWTSATALNTTWTLPLAGSNSCVVGFVVSGTVTQATIVFEVSQDGANWLPIQGAILDGYTNLTGWTQGVGSRAVQFDVSGCAYIRLRLSQVILGTGTVTFILQGSDALTEPVPVIGQANGTNLHMTLDDAAGGNAVNTVAKGTQGARAITTQDMKDSGRTYVSFSLTAGAGVVAEALISFSQNKQGTVTAGVTSYVITSGKTLRITSISYSVRSAAAAIAFSRLALRHNTAGATIATSPVAYQLPEINTNSATSGTSAFITCDIPDGIEFFGNGTQTIGVTHLDQATTNILNVTVLGYEY